MPDACPQIDGPRPARAAELPEILDLLNRVFRPGPACQPTMQQEFPLLLAPENTNHLFIVRADGQVVSHVGVLRQDMVAGGIHLPVACVGSVATDPAHRGRGYASRLLDSATERARRDGCVLMAISGNLPLYTGRGALMIEPVRRAALPAAWAARGPVAPGIRTLRDRDTESLVHLIEREPSRYRVNRRTLPALLHAHNGVLVAEKDQRRCAHAVQPVKG